MPTNLFFDSLTHTQKVFDYGFEQAVEQEILLADYDEPVFKIVKTCLEHTMTQKYISGSKLVLEGFFKLSVYYQPPGSQRLAMTTHKIPFQKQLDLPYREEADKLYMMTNMAPLDTINQLNTEENDKENNG